MSGNLVHNLVLFGRVLRGVGLDANPGRMMDLVLALGFIEIERKADFYHAARSLLVHRKEEIPLFDAAFEAFWRKPAEGWTALDLRAMGEQRRFKRPSFTPPPLRKQNADQTAQESRDPTVGDEPPVVQATMTYSGQEVLRHKDFADLTGEEFEAIKRLMAGLEWQFGLRRTRRMQPGPGDFYDLRRTLRRNLRYGGEVLHWVRRDRKYKLRPLVIIADISGSMERYTRLLLHFIYSLAEAFGHVESFVFSTRLTRITRQLRDRDVDRALREVSHLVPDWSGGTRIGEALKTFNFGWARRVLGRRAVVLIISDGWDRGDADLLRREMSRLQRSCYRLVWLNPLLGSPQYEPLARGMRTALPYVDDFLPVHNLVSLEHLAEHLSHLKARAQPSRTRSQR